MVRPPISTALYLAAATFLGAIVVPASMDLAATHAQALKQLVPGFQALDDTISRDQRTTADGTFSPYSGRIAARD